MPYPSKKFRQNPFTSLRVIRRTDRQADRQTDKQTNRQTDRTKNITSFFNGGKMHQITISTGNSSRTQYLSVNSPELPPRSATLTTRDYFDATASNWNTSAHRAPWQVSLYKDRQSNWRAGVFYIRPRNSRWTEVHQFLADRTIGRAYGTVCRLSVCRLSVVCLWRFVLWQNGAS